MAKRFAFDIQKAIIAAWELLWADNLKRRKQEEKAMKKNIKYSSRWYNTTFYLCAQDIEYQVRAFAEDTYYGRPWRKDRAYGSYGAIVRMPGNLQQMVRNWLFAQASGGRLTYHNFGRGHISGARFRPMGEPMGPSEKETAKKKDEQRRNPRPRPVHFSTGGYGSKPMCVKKRSPFSRSRRSAHTSDVQAEVTCPRCKNLLKDYVPPKHTAEVETGC